MLKKLLFISLMIFSLHSWSATFKSVQDGDWNDASTWTLGAGAGGTEGVDYPSATDIVIIDHYVIIDTPNDGSNFSFSGQLTINFGDTLESQVGDNIAGFVLEGNGLMRNNGSFFTLDAAEEPDETAHVPYEFVCKGNSVFIGGLNSFAFISDDWNIQENAQIFIDNLLCYSVSDDVIFDGTTCFMYGTGNIRIGGDGASSNAEFVSGATVAQLDDDITIWRNVATTNCSGTSLATGTNASTPPPFAFDDSYTTALNSVQNQNVLYNGTSDFSPTSGDTITLSDAGSDAGASNGSTSQGGTVSVNNNGTISDLTDDYIVYIPPTGFVGTDTYNYLITNEGAATDIAVVTVTITACGTGFVEDTTLVAVVSQSDNSGANNPANITGAPDANFTEWHDGGDIQHQDFGQIYTAGTQYKMTWRVRPASTGDAQPVIRESTINGSFTVLSTAYLIVDDGTTKESIITSENDFRYLQITKDNGVNGTDFEIDAIEVLGIDCLLDTDGDGIANSTDIDDDNDGILDQDECTIGNIALNGTTAQSSTRAAGGAASRAIDGNTNGVFSNNSVTHTNTEANPFWLLDLGSEKLIDSVVVWNRTDCCQNRIDYYQLDVEDASNVSVFTFNNTAGSIISETTITNITGRYVRISLSGGTDILSIAEVQVYSSTCDKDTDNDGISDDLDLDSDGDGIADILEAGGIDVDRDGQVDVGTDTDNDGWADVFDSDNGGSVLADSDTDNDGLKNRIDIDSDDDGIVDIIESQASGDLISPSGSDSDGDGIDDNFDIGGGNNLTEPLNTDGADNPDYTDTNSDNDGFSDAIEAYDTDNDGLIDTSPAGTDTDNDGLDDNYDEIVGPNTTTNITNNGQNSSSFPNLDVTNTTEADWREILDSDGDGVADEFDIDDDNDGLLDTDEGCLDGSSSSFAFTSLGQARTVTSAGVYFFNLNGDAFSTYVDADGFVQVAIDFGNGSGALPQGTALNNSTRGILNATVLAELTDANLARISHSGGNLDITTSNATILSRITTNSSLSKGTADNAINDDWTGTESTAITVDASCVTGDNDALDESIAHLCGNTSGLHWRPTSGQQRIRYSSGSFSGEIANGESLTIWVQAELVGSICSLDSDGDGVNDNLDIDSDNDGIADIIEAGGVDADGDGRVDGVFSDADGDGWATTFDNDGEAGTPLTDADTDGDGLENRIDIDADNDGITDNVEARLTANGTVSSGVDTDNDGWDNSYDATDGGTAITLSNIDGGDPDYIDDDSDGDGFRDWIEGFDDDEDGDALNDFETRATVFEAAAGNPMYYVNTDDADTDGIPDWLEDDDADNTPNFLDPDNAAFQDTNEDGLVDLFDTNNFGVASNTPDTDGDGEYDFRDTDDEITLPITLIDFNAFKDGNFVQLDWSTSSEINNDYFTIERLNDKNHFEPILYHNGAGNSTQRIEYQLVDKSPNEGYNYYRLRQTDYDGKTEVSNLVQVFFQNDKLEFRLYPNPFNRNRLKLYFSRPVSDNYKVEIYTISGMLIFINNISIDKETKIVELSDSRLNDLPPGIYTLVLSNDISTYNKKLVKSK